MEENFEMLTDVIENDAIDLVEEGVEVVEMLPASGMNKWTKGGLIALGVGAAAAGGVWLYKKWKRKKTYRTGEQIEVTIREEEVIDEAKEESKEENE